MRTIRHIIAFTLTILMVVCTISAQNIIVTVTPTQQILPPQVMLYITEPANYFNIAITNTGTDNENVFLVMQLEQIEPSSGLSLSTPPQRQPRMPIVVPAGDTRVLSPSEIRGLFNHIPLNEIKAPDGLFDNYANGSFALLPEGLYEAHLTAYHWDLYGEPYVLSSPTGGMAQFNVCYKAQAPEFITPMINGFGLEAELTNIGELDPLSPIITWKTPVVTCNPNLLQYDYSVRIVEMLPGQCPDNSMDANPVVYQKTDLSTPTCMIPQQVIKQMSSEKVYAAQVTATQTNVNNKMLNYVSIENNGKSTYRMFRLVKTDDSQVDEDTQTDEDPDEPVPDEDEDKEPDEDEDEEGPVDIDEDEEDDESDSDINVLIGKTDVGALVEDSLYTFRNPKLIDPHFHEADGVRKRFIESGIEVSWQTPQFVGGEGQRSDTIKIEYEVQLYDNGERADQADALEQEPIYTFRTAELNDTIEWSDMEEVAEAGDYMVLRIKPIVVKGSSVAFTGNDNIVDFALVNRLSKQYFQCASNVEIENTKPTTKSASDLKGTRVMVGEYMLTIDEISGNASDGFKGKGRVEWNPFGSKIMVCVQFDKLKINIDDVVYEGSAVTYAGPKIKGMEAVEKLFSEWGVDNLIGDTGVPYASYLQGEISTNARSIAEQVNLGDYYGSIKDGEGAYNLLTTGEMDNLYMPIKFPQKILPDGWDVVDLQVTNMTFAPTHATMNVIGESILPECNVLESKILVFGAPRLCISPNRFLPESGHIALLGDFIIKPSSDFEMTFKAPTNVLEPKDGCYISWHEDKLELLGIDADMKIAGIVKDVNGKATTERPVINLKSSFGSWSDFLVDNVTIDDFQLEDLPGYTFTAKNIVYDHSDFRNSAHMGKFPERYSKVEAGIKGNEESWHGLHIGEISVKFPKSLELGVKNEDGDKRLKIKGEEMFFDQSGATLKMGASNIFSAKEGTLGGWGISLDEANLEIIQDNLDNCSFSGQLNVPIFDKKKKEMFGNIDYSCEIRRLTDPRKRSKASEETNPTSEQRMRYSYNFLTEQIDDLNFNCFLAQATLDAKQTYFAIEAFDHETNPDNIVTQVELCIGGKMGIGGVDNANASLVELTKDLPLQLKIPDVHFVKMRLSNVKRKDWKNINSIVEGKINVDIQAKQKAREERETEDIAEQKKSVAYHALIEESKELELGSNFYLDLGEWSLASEKKKLGPFSFNLNKFTPSIKDKNLQIEVEGTIGLVEDKINVGAAVVISSKLNTPGNDITKWSLSDGKAEFRGLHLDLDFTALHLKGNLDVIKNSTDKGYSGDLDISITGLLTVACEGGYYEHKADASYKENYSWGYFLVKMESSTGLRFDPLVINRISGGFFFNCQPTAGDDENNKFSGKPVAKYGVIGVALGMKISTSAGEKTLSGDMDLLVCYDKVNNCLSTFMFNGQIKAVGGIINAKASLIYENQKNTGGSTQNRYLCLNVTIEAGADSKALIAEVTKANAALERLKGTMDEFQSRLDKVNIYQMVTNPQQGLKQLSGNYEKNENGDVTDESTEENTSDIRNRGKESEGQDIAAMKTKISLEFKMTWVKNGQTYNTPKWHLYLGEPDKDKRCSFTFLKFDGKIVTVDIGADAYLCLGNELPDGGVLPAIPSKITEFLAGHKSSSTDMGGDLGKAERSRKRAVQKLLDPNSCEGGVMVGASAWGYLKIDLGLLYGYIDALAGFDASLVNYGDNAFCVNSHSKMGKNGWYAMGQLYAYLAAELGLHIKIGSFINEKIAIFHAGIGGVLELGLPNPTWVEGQARIKISLLGGLCKINKKFEFSAGDHCVPFKGNALDGFEMFNEVSLGSDSLYQALMDPTFAISAREAKNMTFTTTSSIGSHYRLVDPSWQDELVERAETTEEDLQERIAMNASRTYVFDIDQNLNQNNMKMGVRLFDLGTDPTSWVIANEKLTEKQLYERLSQSNSDLTYVVSQFYQKRENTVSETSLVMKGKELSSAEDGLLHQTGTNYIDRIINNSKILPYERDVSFREDKGTTFHLTGMNVYPGHSYVLFLSANAYEIDNGKRVWCTYVDDGKEKRIKWKQTKAWFFRVKSDEEERILRDSLRNLQPYIALAYPSIDGTRVMDTRGEGTVTAYFNDIMRPTIALNRDLRSVLPENKMKWVLSVTKPDGTLEIQERDAIYKMDGNCINLEPKEPFTYFDTYRKAKQSQSSAGKTYDFNSELYHLQLNYSYFANIYADAPDSTFQLVDLQLTPLPYTVKIGSSYYTDSWLQTTTSDQQELLPYSYPFVGARTYKQPVIDYEKDYFNPPMTLSNGQTIAGSELLTDEDYVFKNTKYKPYNLPYRLIDPYMYFAYLAKWVFIGDREISPYDFDEVGCKFASESLIYNYNGTTVNTEFLKDVRNKSLYQVRTQMYNVWNDWYYNNTRNHPCWPLPTTSKTVGGITVANQDGKASTITPLNVNHYKDYTYCFQDLVKDYTAVYDVADVLCHDLNNKSSKLMYYYFKNYNEEVKNNKYEFNKNLDADIKRLNQLNRGRYIEVNYRGYSIKIPYYQLPLIYGDCFGGDAAFKGWDLDANKRTFKTSIGEKDLKSGDASAVNLSNRWPSEASNLLFFRLNNAADGKSLYMFDNNKYYGEVFLRYKNQYNSSYINGTSTSKNVAWDEFNKEKALEAVSDFSAILYRVDAYDISTGQYTVNGNRGGGPWRQSVSINAKNGTAKNLAEMTDAIGAKDEYLKTHYDKPRMQALLATSNGKLTGSTLYFVYSDSIYSHGNYKNDDIWRYWDEEDDFDNRSWRGSKSYIAKVVFDPSMADAKIRSLRQWFMKCTELESISGLQYLDTKDVTDMYNMFYDCTKLKSLTGMKNWDTRKVTNMARMFMSCSSLTTLDLSGWNTEKVTNMECMFDECKALKKLSQKFNTAKVTSMSNMFAGCESLTKLELNNFTSEALTSVNSMFKNCKNVTSIALSYVDGMKLAYTYDMFNGCGKLEGLYIKGLCCDDGKLMSSNCDNMFTGVPNSLKSHINYGLIDKIKSQLPGSKTQHYDDSYKVLSGTVTSTGKKMLIFARLTNKQEVGGSYSFTLNGVQRKVKVDGIWMGQDVMTASGSKVPWKNKLENVDEIYIQSSFAQSPSTTNSWFKGAKNLTSIYGLKYMNTSRVTNMTSMFDGCNKLKKLDLSEFDTKNVKYMSRMFANCFELEDMSVYRFNTTNVTNMSGMFTNCHKLMELYLGYDFETKNVTNMQGMFNQCYHLKRIDSPYGYTFDTEKVTDMNHMFYDCKELKWPLEPSSMKNVTDAQYMYYNCQAMEELDLSDADMSKVEKMDYMFTGCSALKDLNLSGVKMGKVQTMKGIFSRCSSLQSLDLSTLNVPKLSEASGMFTNTNTQCTIYIPYNANKKVLDQCPITTFPNLVLIYPCYAVYYKDAGGGVVEFLYREGSAPKVGDLIGGHKIEAVWSGRDVMDRQKNSGDKWNGLGYKVLISQSFKTIPIINAHNYFSNSNLTTIQGLGNLNLSKAKDLSGMFEGCKNLKGTLDLTQWDTSSATDMSSMFQGCSGLTHINVSKFNTAKVTNMQMMFYGCSSLTTLNLSNFNTANVENMMLMFSGCKAKEEFNITKFNTSKVKDGAAGLFGSCSKLRKISLSGIDTKNWDALLSLFSGCSSLEELNLSSLDLTNIKQVFGLFDGCTSLRKLTLGSRVAPEILKSGYHMESFEGVHDLTVVVPEEKLQAVRTAFIDKLGFVEGVTGTFVTKDPGKVAQVIWTADNSTLTFFYGAPVGSTFNGQVVNAKWSGDNVLNNTWGTQPWQGTIKDKVTKVVFDPSFANARPKSTKSWFYNCSKLITIEGMEYLNTSQVKDMSWMFCYCLKLESIDLSHFYTTNVTDMSYMFYYDCKLKKLDLSKFSTTNVTNMNAMFMGCKISELDLTKFNTRKVTSAVKMFKDMTSLKTLLVGQNFTFPSLTTNSSDAFKSVKGLEVNVHSNYMQAVKTDMINKLGFVENAGGENGEFVATDKMEAQVIWTESNKVLTFFYGKKYNKGDKFKNGKIITAIWRQKSVTESTYNSNNGAPWSSTVKDKVTSVNFHSSFAKVHPTVGAYWFWNCKNLTSVTGVSFLNTDKMSRMTRMFFGCSSLSNLDVSHFDLSACQYMANMFNGCTKLTSLNVSQWNISKVTSLQGVFSGCSKLHTLNVSGWNTSKVTDMSNTFNSCSALTTIDISGWNTEKVTTMKSMFEGCSKVKKLETTYFNTSKVTDMSRMFYNCSKITNVYVSSFDVSKVKDFSRMFYNCSKVWTFNLGSWNTVSATDMTYMFYNCSGADLIDTWHFKTANVTSMKGMFSGCTKMQAVRDYDWKLDKVTDMSKMFSRCTSLYSYSSPSSMTNTPQLTDMNQMFYGCTNLDHVSFSKFNTAKVTSLSGLFYGCKKLSSADLSNFNTVKVEKFSQMFKDCSALKTLKVSGNFSSAKAGVSLAFEGVSGVKVMIMNTNTSNRETAKKTVATTLNKIRFTNKTTGTVQVGEWSDPFDF